MSKFIFSFIHFIQYNNHSTRQHYRDNKCHCSSEKPVFAQISKPLQLTLGLTLMLLYGLQVIWFIAMKASSLGAVRTYIDITLIKQAFCQWHTVTLNGKGILICYLEDVKNLRRPKKLHFGLINSHQALLNEAISRRDGTVLSLAWVGLKAV